MAALSKKINSILPREVMLASFKGILSHAPKWKESSWGPHHEGKDDAGQASAAELEEALERLPEFIEAQFQDAEEASNMKLPDVKALSYEIHESLTQLGFATRASRNLCCAD